MITSLKSSVAKIGALLTLCLLTPTYAMAATGSANLKADDLVGVSFWVISMALVAATAFFFVETQRVKAKWKTSLTVSGLVTLVAATHYFYMRDVWVTTGSTPTVFRYIDWLIASGVLSSSRAVTENGISDIFHATSSMRAVFSARSV